MKKSLVTLSIVCSLSLNSLAAAEAAVKPGTSCPSAGSTSTANGRVYTCIKLGSKLYWNNGTLSNPSATTKQNVAPHSGTVSQQNASNKAASYLRSSSFSRSGLIAQLQYEGFSVADATYGTDSQNADWNQQAALKAASYLKSSAFSRSGLIAQLEYEGFTRAQAEYGVSRTGL
jgi:hypothetical protein